MNRNEERDVLTMFGVPQAPNNLKQRVLEAASEALKEAPGPSLWDFLWESRPLRVTWGVVIVGLVVANVVISFPATPQPRAEIATIRGEFKDLRKELDLPSVEVGPRAEALVMGPLRDPMNESESRDDTREDDEVQS